MADLIQILRDKTFENALETLDAYNKCVIIRPTGFGKTGILVRFFELYKTMHKYRNIVYLYPNDITYKTALNFYFGKNIPKDPTIPNVRFISYHKLIMLSKDDFKAMQNTDLIISDECHKLGAQETRRAFKRMMSVLTDAALLGATATPVRSDLINVVDRFFDDHITYEYTLHHAFQDNVLQKPYYCYCTYHVDTAVEDIAKQTRLNIMEYDDKSEITLRSRLIEISNLLQMDKIIKKTCDEYAKDTNYMKFIIFFSNFNHLHDKYSSVCEWFQAAYPTHDIRTCIITSENKDYHNNIHNLQNLNHLDQTIDLIFCCDMLNLGYHVDDITGICMYRGTSSSTVYIQQLGRALNANYSGIVFDWVDNLHRLSVYDALGKRSKKTIQKQTRYEILKKKIEINDPNDPPTDLEIKEYERLEKTFNRDRWYYRANELEPMDLTPTRHMAEYKELIAKTVAEPISIRCRQAWANWKEHGGDDSIMTKKHILGQQAPNGHPLDKYAAWKQVSIEQVLKEMGVKD